MAKRQLVQMYYTFVPAVTVVVPQYYVRHGGLGFLGFLGLGKKLTTHTYLRIHTLSLTDTPTISPSLFPAFRLRPLALTLSGIDRRRDIRLACTLPDCARGP